MTPARQTVTTDPAPLRVAIFDDVVAARAEHFHMTTAYSILRHNGLELGKMDYLVDLPFVS